MYYEPAFERIQGLTSLRQTATSLQGEINFNRITLFTVDNYTREIDRSHRLSTGQIQSSKVESVIRTPRWIAAGYTKRKTAPVILYPRRYRRFPPILQRAERTALEELFGR